MKYIMCSRFFPKEHPRQGEQTFFVEKILNSIYGWAGSKILNRLSQEVKDIINDFYVLDGEQKKHHTIRAGSRYKSGDMVSLRVWSNKPYRSKQIEFAKVEIKKTWGFKFFPGERELMFSINSESWPVDWREGIHHNYGLGEIAKNDGLAIDDFMNWFNIHPKKQGDVFCGQIICWSDSIEYSKHELVTEKQNNE